VKRTGYLLLMALFLLAIPALLAQEASETAEPDGLKCSDIAPPTAAPTYYIGAGNVYFDAGDYSRAIVAYTCALQLDPNYAPAYVSRGFANAAQLNDEAAAADYDRALALDGNLVTAYNNYGLLYAGQGNFGLALTQLNLAVALAPTNAVGYNNRGVVHAIEGNYELAIADFKQAITLDADYSAPHASLGATYTAMANASYDAYYEIEGEGAILPGVTAENILAALEQRDTTGDFTIWLSFMTPTK
jgi:tetratricopeptide (TPR) repeat protein